MNAEFSQTEQRIQAYLDNQEAEKKEEANLDQRDCGCSRRID